MLTTDWMFSQLGKSVSKARAAYAAYAAFVLDGLDEERRPEFYGSGVDSRLLGDDNFMDKCLSGAGGMALHLTAQQLIETVSRAYHLDADLYFRSKLGTVPSPIWGCPRCLRAMERWWFAPQKPGTAPVRGQSSFCCSFP